MERGIVRSFYSVVLGIACWGVGCIAPNEKAIVDVFNVPRWEIMRTQKTSPRPTARAPQQKRNTISDYQQSPYLRTNEVYVIKDVPPHQRIDLFEKAYREGLGRQPTFEEKSYELMKDRRVYESGHWIFLRIRW